MDAKRFSRRRRGLAPMEFVMALPILILLVWTISQMARVYLVKYKQTIKARNEAELLVQQSQLTSDKSYNSPFMDQAFLAMGREEFASGKSAAGVGTKVLLKEFDARPITILNNKIITRFYTIRGEYTKETTPFDNSRGPLTLMDTKRLFPMVQGTFFNEISQGQNIISQISGLSGITP
jgi:hypothetical protein